MNKFRKVLAMLLSVCLLASFSISLAEAQDVTAVATDEVTDAVAVTAPQLADTDVIATVEGTDITWADAATYYQSLVNYYGEPDDTSLELYYAVAMEEAVTMKLIQATAAANGLDQYTDDEKAAINASSDSDWQSALDNYVQSASSLTDESTDEEKASAYAEAEAYYGNLGYTKDILRQNYLDNETYTRVQEFVCKDITVTDDDIQQQYETNVANDQALYENDLDSYEYQLMLYNYQYATEKPWYHPAGYRYVKHILLPVDDTLMSTYTDLQARLEEQMENEADTTSDTAADATAAPDATAEADTTPEPTETPVTEADVDNAKADILTSLQDKTTEIYDKIAQGEDFDALIAEYGVNADGTASDPGMTSGDYPNGYEVALASTSFVPEFVEAAFSIDEIGGVSAPYVSDYGVHIVKYMGDVPAGPVELTDELKESIRSSLLTDKNSAAMDAWQAAADIQYTGLLKTVDELQGTDSTDSAE
ncbi:MAG: peptidylprolyl isomerase [Eubacteriales bacterium]|nr:peptidylprolyl isomerase [Eubacteriales bacterium]